MKTALLLTAFLVFASVSRAQVYEESQPPPPAPAPASPSGGSSYYMPDYDDSCCYPVPREISPSNSTGSANTVPAPSSPANSYAHGDAGWVPSTYVNYQQAVRQGRQQQAASQSVSQSQARPNISNQFRNLVLEKRIAQQNAGNPSSPSQPQLHAQNSSLGDMARQIREKEANAPKAQVIIKQDAQGNAVLIPKKQ